MGETQTAAGCVMITDGMNLLSLWLNRVPLDSLSSVSCQRSRFGMMVCALICFTEAT